MKLAIFYLFFSVIASATSSINGAGATFPYPLYSRWFSEYQKIDPNVQINYQSIGSGGGIRQFLDKTLDFAATDIPMTDEMLAKTVPGTVLHVPMVLGAVTVTFNLPGITELRFSGETVADIFLGKIKKWEDPRITSENPGFTFKGDILVTHRSDGSGTTAVFSQYLARVSSEWAKRVGMGTALSWPVGLGGKGNEGVAGLVKNSPGSLGYVELVYAEFNHLSFASLKNQSGAFIKPTLATITAAAMNTKAMPADLRWSVVDSDVKNAYPLSSFTFLLLNKAMPDPIKAARLVKFLRWALTDGQKIAPELLYAPLPEVVAKKALSQVQIIDPKRAR
jgi:phosphate transport system substrate-binding protein